MEFHVILTLSKSLGPGHSQQATIIQTVTADPGSTRNGLLAWALKKAPEGMEGACILFFSAEPNALPTALKAVKD